MFCLPLKQIHHSLFLVKFASHFNEACQLVSPDCSSNNLDAEQHLILFNSTCTEILDFIAPFRRKHLNAKAEP